MKRTHFSVLLLIILALFGSQINGAQAQPPVVYAALFYSPSCGHCHYVITEILPPLQETYGDQLQVLYIDVSQPGGNAMFGTICDTFDVPGDRCGYVPTLVIGTTVLVGGAEIPEQLPGLVKTGIEAGGLDIPAIPGLKAAYEASLNDSQTHDSAQDAANTAAISTTYQETTWQSRFNQDPLGNGLALGVLGILAAGLVVHVSFGMRVLTNDTLYSNPNRFNQSLATGLALISTIIAATLVLQNGSLSLPTVLASAVTLGMLFVVWNVSHAESKHQQEKHTSQGWVIPIVACLGLAVASYLAYIEINGNEAVCGAVGDCNTVQQSDYAKVFGVIPIGLLGVFGYIMILTAWAVKRRTDGQLADAAHVALLGLALFGTAFSIYLTFLEPFVIGATCAWCLTSAMFMILILTLQAPEGWTSTNRLVDMLAQTQRAQNRTN